MFDMEELKAGIFTVLFMAVLMGGLLFWFFSLFYDYENTKAQRELCNCEPYLRVRQDCATAGDFQNCIRVKMGSKDYAHCDLKVILKTELPGGAACWLHRNLPEEPQE